VATGFAISNSQVWDNAVPLNDNVGRETGERDGDGRSVGAECHCEGEKSYKSAFEHFEYSLRVVCSGNERIV